ncbi:unnamed protein product, partial [Nesidiocoris tenuis]
MLLDPSTARLSVLHIKINSNNSPLSPEAVKASPSETQNVTAVSSVDGNITYHVGNAKKETPKPKSNSSLFAVITTALASPPLSRQKYVVDKQNADTSREKESVQPISLYINPFSSETSTINTDFDEFFEEVDDDSLKDSAKTEPLNADGHKVTRNRSFPSLEKDPTPSKSYVINEALKLTSLDLLSLSDTIMTKVSDGEPFPRLNRGSFSSDGISQMASLVESNDLVRSWTFPNKDADASDDADESTAADEYFSSGTLDSVSVVEDVMNDILDKVTQLADQSE